MRLAIVGRGRMGAAIRSVARELGHDVVLEIDTKSPLVGGPTPSALGDVEVALDFTGITEIGPAFADEIFRVYKREHPNVHLYALSQSFEVARVIERVQEATSAVPD